MREISILRWCDACGPDERQPSVSTFTAGVSESETDRPELKILDLCGEHAKTLIAPVVDLLALTGQHPEPAPIGRQRPSESGPPSSEPQACRICGRMLIGSSSLVGHIYGKHLHTERPVTPLRCAVCGESFGSAGGAAMHASIKHGRSALDVAYSAARSAGLLR